MLAEFMSDESVVAGLAKPVVFGDDQIAFIKNTLAEHPNVRWTFLFLHEPAWEKPSESFEAVQQLLKDRNHTFFGGHLHYYDYDKINGYEHITMGPVCTENLNPDVVVMKSAKDRRNTCPFRKWH